MAILKDGRAGGTNQAGVDTVNRLFTGLFDPSGNPISSSNPLPVASAAVTDLFPATQNISAADTGSTTTVGFDNQSIITGTPSANSAAVFALSSNDTINIQITGNLVGTLYTEYSIDGGTTWTRQSIKISGTSQTSSTITALPVIGMTVAAGRTHYRIRCGALTSGTATVKVTLSNNPGVIYNAGSQTIADASAANVANVKAASTPAAATDTSLVVALSPNSPTPNFASAQPITAAALPLPAGAAIETGGNLAGINGKLTTTANGLKTDNSGVVQPISASALPLPAGAAIESGGNLASINTKLTTTANGLKTDNSGVVQPISASALPLPSGAATAANQSTEINTLNTIATNTAVTDSTQLGVWTQRVQDGSGNPIASSNAQPVGTEQGLMVRIPGYVSAASIDGQKASYSASVVGLVASATAPTDVVTIYGSASKTIRVTRIVVTGTQATAAVRDILLIKRSTANTGGTSTAPVAVPHDSASAAATAVLAAYTANPSALGTAVGNVRTHKLYIGATTGVGAVDALVWEFGTRPAQAIVLRGTAQGLAINLNGVVSGTSSLDIIIEWTEE